MAIGSNTAINTSYNGRSQQDLSLGTFKASSNPDYSEGTMVDTV